LSYTFRIVNRGKVFADNVTVWLVDTWGSQLGSDPVFLTQMVPATGRRGAEPRDRAARFV